MSPAATIALGLVIAGALIVLFPQHELLERVMKARRDDPLTVQYLVNLHAKDPANSDTALLLAGARLAQGQPDDALRLVAPLESHPDAGTRRRALLMHAESLRDPAARSAFLLARLDEQWSREELGRIADFARGAKEPGLRRAVYPKLAALEQDPKWFARTAREMLGEGDYRLSADLWFSARRLARNKDSQKKYFLEGIRTLQSGNLLAEAMAAAEANLGDLAQDEDTVLAVAQLALASGRPDIAERWMKRVLWPAAVREPAARGHLPSFLEKLAQWLITSAHGADSQPSVPSPAMRPYDERVYTFAYDVFLANGNLESAYRVAEAAVSQRPDDLAWREKLARAAEWSKRPAEALEQWLFLAQRGGRDEAWQGVLRLAPGLGADETLFLATRHKVERKGAKPEELREFAALYERLGRPRDGISWFVARFGATGEPLALELAATLADRAGERDRAIELYQQLIALQGPEEKRLIRTATLLVLAGKFGTAHELLKKYRAQTRKEAEEYWDLLGDLAWRLQDDESATFAYRTLSARAEANAGEFDRLVTLLRDDYPEEAAKFAEFGFERFRTPGLLLSALELRWERRDLPALKRLYAGIDAAAEKLFDTLPYFYSLRAQYRQAEGMLKGARADLERAIEIAPNNGELKVALTWLLIESRDLPALRRQLEQTARGAGEDRDLWALQAAGWTTLGDYRRAVPFHARLARDKPDDYLGLMGYADALEQAGQAGESARVRRQAWGVVRKMHAQASLPSDPQQQRQLRETTARLALALSPADTALAVIRDLMRRDFAPDLAPDEKKRSAAVTELVLSWAISGEQYSNAKAWLWLQYGRKLAAPGWAEASIALGENDVEGAERLLADRMEAIPRYNRIDLARLTRQVRLAQTMAFDEQTRLPDDDTLHLQLADSILEGVNRMVGGAMSSTRGAVRSQPRELATQVWATPRLRLALEWREASQSSTSTLVLASIPARDRETKLTVRQLLDTGWVEFGIGQREAFADQSSQRAALFTEWRRGLTTLVSVSRNERTLDSTALAIAGSKDEVAARFSLALAKREYLVGGLRQMRYHTQNGSPLGSGRAIEGEAGHRVRVDYPDVTLRVTAADYRFSAGSNDDARTAALNPAGGIPNAAFFVPQPSRILGAGIGVGESIRESYTRALRPYGSFSRTVSSLAGSGYNALVGAGGSVLGADQLSLYWNRARGGGSSGASILEYGLRYEYYFDRF